MYYTHQARPALVTHMLYMYVHVHIAPHSHIHSLCPETMCKKGPRDLHVYMYMGLFYPMLCG